MSYRHNSYRKLNKVTKKAQEQGSDSLTRAELERFFWSKHPRLGPKPDDWGRARAHRV